MILFGRHVVALFISADAANAAEALSVAYDYLVVMSTFLLSAYVLHTYRSALQGMGFTTAPMLSGLTEFAGRVGASLLLTRSSASAVCSTRTRLRGHSQRYSLRHRTISSCLSSEKRV